MAIAFFIMTLVMVPALVSNILGGEIAKEERVSFFDPTTLSNQNDYRYDNLTSSSSAGQWLLKTENKNFLTDRVSIFRYLVIYADVLYSLFLIIWVIAFWIYAGIKVQKLEDH